MLTHEEQPKYWKNLFLFPSTLPVILAMEKNDVFEDARDRKIDKSSQLLFHKQPIF